MRWKIILGLFMLTILFAVGVVVRVATRQRVEVLHSTGDSGSGSVQSGLVAIGDRILVAEHSRFEVLNDKLEKIDEIGVPLDNCIELGASRDGSLAFMLDYREFCLVDLRTKAVKTYPLDFFATTGFLSPNAEYLWLGEYETSKFRQWKLVGTEATKVAESDIKLEAGKQFGAPRLSGNNTFRVAGVADKSTATILHSDDFNALLIFDWRDRRTLGTIDLPNLVSNPRFSQSPSGQFLGVVQNWLVIVDVHQLKTVFTCQLDDRADAIDFNAGEDRVFVGYRAPDLLALPFLNRGGQIDEFDLTGQCVNTWHSDFSRIRRIHTRTANLWISGDDKILRFRLK